MKNPYPSRFVEFFGPSAWRLMHAVAFTYPENPDATTRKKYIDFFKSIGNVLPCPSCRGHYNEYMEKNPIEADSTESLARWVYDLHDDVNARREKYDNQKIYRPSFEEVVNIYTGYEGGDEEDQRRDPVGHLRRLGDPFAGNAPSLNHAPPSGIISLEDRNSKLMSLGITVLILLVMYGFLQSWKKQNNE